jgi:hypothetical protein
MHLHRGFIVEITRINHPESIPVLSGSLGGSVSCLTCIHDAANTYSRSALKANPDLPGCATATLPAVFDSYTGTAAAHSGSNPVSVVVSGGIAALENH